MKNEQEKNIKKARIFIKRYFRSSCLPVEAFGEDWELVEGQFDITDKTMVTEFKPEKFLKDKKRVAEALLQSLIENDTEAYMEILDSYLRVNRSRIAQEADISRSTASLAFSKKGNPTLKTIAKIVHKSVCK